MSTQTYIIRTELGEPKFPTGTPQKGDNPLQAPPITGLKGAKAATKTVLPIAMALEVVNFGLETMDKYTGNDLATARRNQVFKSVLLPFTAIGKTRNYIYEQSLSRIRSQEAQKESGNYIDDSRNGGVR